MAGRRITEMTQVTALTPDDLLVAVDVEDPQQSAQGTTVAVKVSNVFTNATLTNPVVAGDLTGADHVIVSGTDDSTSASTGAIQTAGGIGVAKKGWFGELVSMTRLVLRQAASVIVPGATSFAVRNNADTENNLLVEDDGDVTVRKDLAVGNDLTVGNDISATGDVSGVNAVFSSSNIGSVVTAGDLISGASGIQLVLTNSPETTEGFMYVGPDNHLYIVLSGSPVLIV